MAGDGEIRVTFGSIAQAQTDTSTAFTNIQNELTNLRNYLKPLTASWTGTAAQNYTAQQTKWDNAVTDLNAVLQTISQGLGVAHQNYTETESVNSRMWT
ncbi:WXG100 family type VII secretion target [Frankia sp. AiPs1]|uniref:WXG100 family type VII secretion target n=1 Tax=Frankia sp. AiPs1 TaxID=573493 RepID=UPI00204338DD|nr:WXG100 family type VII secretion target [Frankia sp. AiPs1]MCM3921857.1 WXG100 family type VII secretion target [Frankia sp. AiPs1]